MSLHAIFPFTTPENYEYDSDKIEIIGGVARLKLVDDPGNNFEQNFISSDGFTFDPDRVEFSGGTLQQKDKRPADSICAATFTNGKDLSWAKIGFSSLTGVLNGLPVVSGGKLVCTEGEQKGVYYSDPLIGNLSGNWVAKFKYTPDYSISPTGNMNIFSISQSSGSTDRIVIFNSPSGNNIRITANGLTTVIFDRWEPAAGQEYIFEVHCLNNVVTLFIDNVQLGTGKIISPAQGTDSNRVWLGAYTGLYNIADGSFDDFILYASAVQTDIYTIPEYSFLESLITLPAFNYSGLGTIQNLTDWITTENNLPRYIINGKYFNGSGWVNSNYSYDQANTKAEILVNFSGLLIDQTILTISIIFQNSNSQQSISILQIEYSGQIYPADNPIIKPYMSIYMNELESGEEIVNKSGLDNIKYNVEISGVWYWINGSGIAEPVTADDYSQSNSVAEWNAALTQWDPPQAVYIRFRAFLHSEDGSTTPELDNMVLNYIYRGDPPDTIHTTLLWGRSFDGEGVPVENDIVIVTPAKQVQEYKTNTIILKSELTASSNSEGYWQLYLIESDNLSNGFYFIIQKGITYKFKIPEQQKICINDLSLERV